MRGASTFLPGLKRSRRIEQLLQLAHRAVQLVAEDAPVELAAHESVAVLAAVHAAVLRDEVAHLVGHGAQRLDRPGAGEVHERTDVQASRRGVSIEAGAQPVAREQLGEARRVLGEVRRIHRRVLDERQRALAALCPPR